MIKGDRVLKAMKKFIPDANIEDLKIKYTATAFDLAQNKEIVFRKGKYYDAIRASISIPTVFTPVVSGDAVLVDGGVVNNIPVNNAIRTKNDLLIAVYVNADVPVRDINIAGKNQRQELYTHKINEFRKSINRSNSAEQKKKFHYFNLINDTIAVMTNHQASTILRNSPPDILVEIAKRSCGTFDFYKAEELVEMGRYATREKLDSLQEQTKAEQAWARV
ncbi:MAG: patatin-like phospholipase family protein [Bacteroidales bacterium]|nr:patatin-like phospholipase family protein [Bacteroidales bacterium]